MTGEVASIAKLCVWQKLKHTEPFARSFTLFTYYKSHLIPTPVLQGRKVYFWKQTPKRSQKGSRVPANPEEGSPEPRWCTAAPTAVLALFRGVIKGFGLMKNSNEKLSAILRLGDSSVRNSTPHNHEHRAKHPGVHLEKENSGME